MYKPDNISSTEQLYEECKGMHEFLQEGYNVDSGKECSDRAAMLASYMARTGKMLADAKFHKDSILNSEILELLRKQYHEYLPATTINKAVDAACKDINFLVNWITEIDKEIKYQVELMRTFISQAKELTKVENYTRNVQNQTE